MQIVQTIRFAIMTLSLLTALGSAITTGIYATRLERRRAEADERARQIEVLKKELAEVQKMAHDITYSYEEQLLSYQKARELLKNTKTKNINNSEVIDDKASRDVCSYCNELFGL